MMTGEQYRRTLNDDRATYFEGERVRDIVNHPVLGACVARVAAGYDLLFYSPEPNAVSPIMGIPHSAAEVKERIPLTHESDILRRREVRALPQNSEF